MAKKTRRVKANIAPICRLNSQLFVTAELHIYSLGRCGSFPLPRETTVCREHDLPCCCLTGAAGFERNRHGFVSYKSHLLHQKGNLYFIMTNVREKQEHSRGKAPQV
uniref:Uncharacterized protein n=1 Tax=Sphaerodactylus townsendi TaxID=933632 RepID=A0ACB8E624_9SAUR